MPVPGHGTASGQRCPAGEHPALVTSCSRGFGVSTRMLVQVCESLVEPQTRKREAAALGEAMGELGLKTIEVVPVWRFLLDLPIARVS